MSAHGDHALRFGLLLGKRGLGRTLDGLDEPDFREECVAVAEELGGLPGTGQAVRLEEAEQLFLSLGAVRAFEDRA